MLKQETLNISNMLCTCCTKLIKLVFEKADIKVLKILPGEVTVIYDNGKHNFDTIDKLLKENGMALIKSKDQQIVEQIKIAVNELIHHSNNINSILRKSDYLVEKLGMSYQQLSKLFSKYEDMTLEKYIIKNKIERIKELIDSEEFSISEIAYMMDYSSVHYLSNQFKKETGMSVSEYKKRKSKNKIYLDQLTNN